MAVKNPPSSKKKKDPVLPEQAVSEKSYRTFFEYTALPAIIVKKDATISLANRKFQEMSGYSLREIEGKKTWMEFVSPDDVDSITNYLS
ncbi:MAG: PAS domain S-box protein, partial [Methanoregula sp.]